MIRWRILLIPVVAGGISAAAASVDFWDGAKQAFLVSLSVVAAGVLVRLARGLPFTSPDHYEVEEIRELTKAVEQICRSLRALIVVVLMAMVSLALAKPVSVFLEGVPALHSHAAWTERAISSLLAFLLSYVFVRMFQVVQGDYNLTLLQSKFIVRAVERQQAKRFDKSEAKRSATPFKTPEGYGKIVQ